jgi:hypothetical protein
MRRLTIAACAAGVVALGTAPAASAYGGPNPNSNAVGRCGDVIARQTDEGIAAGGGPKAGIPAPTNCDHFFQATGAIGNGLPGSSP